MKYLLLLMLLLSGCDGKLLNDQLKVISELETTIHHRELTIMDLRKEIALASPEAAEIKKLCEWYGTGWRVKYKANIHSVEWACGNDYGDNLTRDQLKIKYLEDLNKKCTDKANK